MSTTTRAYRLAWLVLALLLAGAAAAPPALPALLEQARQALARQDQAEVVRLLHLALAEARQRAPLEVSALTVVAADPTGLGMFQPAPGGRVEGGTLRLYAEVRNFGLRQAAGSFQVDLAIDAAFFYEDGERIALKQDIGRHSFTAATAHEVTFVAVELKTRGLPAQAYQVELGVRDLVSGKRGAARAPFVITDPAPR